MTDKKSNGIGFILILTMATQLMAVAADLGFRGAPAGAARQKNPFAPNDPNSIRAGSQLFSEHCASCHGQNAEGMGNVPSLSRGPVQTAAAGDLFWFIEKGAVENGMPPSNLPAKQRWQVVSYLKSLSSPLAAPPAQKLMVSHPSAGKAAPAPTAPFTDYRFEHPGVVHKILAKDLPAPAEGSSVGNGPEIVTRPADAWPKVPHGFSVQLFAEGLDNPRLIRTAPNGDIFLAESESGKIRVFRGLSPQGKPTLIEIYTTDLNRPYGIGFYPPGKDPKWLYIGNTDAIVRFPYQSGDLKARGPAQKIAELPHSLRGHWTRDLQFSLDGKQMFVAVGSASNIDDSDVGTSEKERADILVMDPDGSHRRIYSSGIRNAGGGLAIHPVSGQLWASVNERDGLGDNLVPDYITHVQEGGFYGWPWWYLGGHQDPRHLGKHPELKDRLLTPDVLLQPHHASLQINFYQGKQFPSEFQGDLFATQHGSWNRSVRTGYELIRVPFHKTTKASGEYQDFMTGFVVDDGHVWGRPVGVTTAVDGSLLVSDDGSNSIWRIVYGK